MLALGGPRGKDSLEEARAPHDLVVVKPDPVRDDGSDNIGDGPGYLCGLATGWFAS
jgi:hypothetical protein